MGSSGAAFVCVKKTTTKKKPSSLDIIYTLLDILYTLKDI